MKSWVYSIAPRKSTKSPPCVFDCAAQRGAMRRAARRESTTRPKNNPTYGWLADTYGWLAPTYGWLVGIYGWLAGTYDWLAEPSVLHSWLAAGWLYGLG